MKRSGRKQEWSLTMFAFGVLFFFPPVVSLFDKPRLTLGVPLAYLVMFGAWGLIILGIWLGARPTPLRGDAIVATGDKPREPSLDPVRTHVGNQDVGRS